MRDRRGEDGERDGSGRALAHAYCRARFGLDAPLVTVECHLSGGLPGFSVVGLPETAVREARERVRSALLAQGFPYPDRRITINLAPAELPKQGSRFDLALALAILAASGVVPQAALARHEPVAELGLDGSLRPTPALLPAASAAAAHQRPLIVASAGAALAALDAGAAVLPAPDLAAVVAHLRGEAPLPRQAPARIRAGDPEPPLLFEDVLGQAAAKRALVVAAAGGHNVLLHGPPGTGKTLLASRFTSLLPPLTEAEALEVARIRSLDPVAPGGGTEVGGSVRRPFRAPHHSASAAALVGGGGPDPRPGEVTRAHHGVLFLDELPEFDRRALEMLREPLETGRVHLARARFRITWPARFQLVAAMNPCPAGIECPGPHACRCAPQQRLRYRQKLSGPLLDRIDLQVHVPNQAGRVVLAGTDERNCADPGETAFLRRAVIRARALQRERQGGMNAELPVGQLLARCALAAKERQRLEDAADRLGLSARGCHRVLRVARTVADLARAERVEQEHLDEALAYRSRSAVP